MADSIPVIDLAEFPMQRSKLLEACEEWGCFRVINHGIPLRLLSEMKTVVRSLFDLPKEIKCRNLDAIPGSGYVGPTEKNPLYEAFGLYDISSMEAVEGFCSQLDTSPRERKTIILYAQSLQKLAMDIAKKISESLGVEGEFVGWPCQFRINKYSFTEETIGSCGVQLHTDSGFLTVLQEDESVGGLEVMNSVGDFISVDPSPGSLVVNLGDLAKDSLAVNISIILWNTLSKKKIMGVLTEPGSVWSNGRFCNIQHRVQCKEAATRISIALFLLGPRKDEVVTPPLLVDSGNPQQFQPFLYEDYRKLRLSTGLRAGEALHYYRYARTSTTTMN